MATILDGKATAAKLNEQTAQRVAQLQQQHVQPGIAVILVGDDPASQMYTRNKHRQAEKLGMRSVLKQFPASISQAELLVQVQELNADDQIHAILVQSPLPDHLDAVTITNAILPNKDVDGFNPVNLGKLYANQPGNYPVACTPKGIMTLLSEYSVPLAGQRAVVIGRSVLVGKPIAALLMNAGATVTLANRLTPDLNVVAREADILVVATGVIHLIGKAAVKPGAVVIDVGINHDENGHLVGDVDFDVVAPIVGAITPVPGGVGPMTIATLMQQTVELAQWSMVNGK